MLVILFLLLSPPLSPSCLPLSLSPALYLYLHPALEAVPEEVCRDGVEHVDLERPEGDRLLVVVVPGALQAARLVPNLLHLQIAKIGIELALIVKVIMSHFRASIGQRRLFSITYGIF